MELQHVNVKLPLKNPEGVDLGSLIPVFHSWIQDQVCHELLLDVADYRHVPDGPGVVLIGHEADYGLDKTDGRLGVRYNRKAMIAGSNQDRLEQAVRSALWAAQRLEEDTRLSQKLSFSAQEFEIWINDRLLAPNREQTRVGVETELGPFLDRLLAGGRYTLTFNTDPRRLLSVRIKSEREFSPTELVERVRQGEVARKQ